MKLNDIINLCKEVARGANVTDNERVDDRLWQDFILLKRNQFIKNYLNSYTTPEQNTLQFEILNVEVYDPALILGGISVGKVILRTEPCPTLIEGRGGMAIYELTSADTLSRTIQPVAFERLRWCGNGKVNKHFLFAAFYDGRWYIKSNSEIEKPISKLRVVGVFADPTLVSSYNRLTDDFPCNDYMLEYVKNAIMQTDFNIVSQTPSDNTNDSSGQVEQGRKISQ